MNIIRHLVKLYEISQNHGKYSKAQCSKRANVSSAAMLPHGNKLLRSTNICLAFTDLEAGREFNLCVSPKGPSLPSLCTTSKSYIGPILNWINMDTAANK